MSAVGGAPKKRRVVHRKKPAGAAAHPTKKRVVHKKRPGAKRVMKRRVGGTAVGGAPKKKRVIRRKKPAGAAAPAKKRIIRRKPHAAKPKRRVGGTGPSLEQLQKEARRLGIPLSVKGVKRNKASLSRAIAYRH